MCISAVIVSVESPFRKKSYHLDRNQSIDFRCKENEDDGNESLEPGETEISNFSDYRSEPYIPPQLSRMQQDKINERFQLIPRKRKCE